MAGKHHNNQEKVDGDIDLYEIIYEAEDINELQDRDKDPHGTWEANEEWKKTQYGTAQNIAIGAMHIMEKKHEGVQNLRRAGASMFQCCGHEVL